MRRTNEQGGELIRVLDVAISPRDGGSDAIYTYRAIERAGVGDAVFVPLGTRSLLGYVVARRDVTPGELGFPEAQLRAPHSVIEGIGIPPVMVETARFVADEYLAPLTQALTVAMPPGVRERLGTEWRLTGQAADPATLTVAQRETLRTLEDAGGTLLVGPNRPLPAQSERTLKLLRVKKLVESRLCYLPFSGEREAAESFRLTANAERIDRFLRVDGKRKPAQAMTLMQLQGSEQASFSRAEIRALTRVTDATVRALIKAELLVPVAAVRSHGRPAPPPNLHQAEAISQITRAIEQRVPENFLLFGVTGSGKTEVYLRSAAVALRLGRPVLILVPEIALTAQVIAQLRDRFGEAVAVLHSDLPAKERLQNWERIRSGEASLVLGPRSALFAPLADIGLIVLDEEHEGSYKQESSPRYHARRVAQFLGRRHGAPVVFGSATPSIETFFDAQAGRLRLLRLPVRAAEARLPLVHIEDLGEGYRQRKPRLFTDALRNRIEGTLARGEQVILFLNRRAYAPFLLCRECGYTPGCPDCAVSLSFHRHERALRCHHCDRRERAPETCPKCGGERIAAMGSGTERVEEAVASEFARAVVDRLDRDVARKRGGLETVLANFRSGATNVLVGTQMVAKGLDFPNVTLVGVIAADISLNLPDFRASERTFQLLSQVAGRAGRGSRPGEVVIQTFSPQNPAVVCAQRHDYEEFYRIALETRRLASYPPFARLVNIVLAGEDLARVIGAGSDLRVRLLEFLGEDAVLLGPVDCPISRLQGRYRRHLLLKLPPDASATPLRPVIERFDPTGVQVTVDIDPQSLV